MDNRICKLMKAKEYIDKMANGINPVDNELVKEGDSLNNVYIARCLFFVSNELNNIISQENNHDLVAEGKAKVKKDNFVLSEEDLKNYNFDDKPVNITTLTNKLNDCISKDNMKKINYKSIGNWLAINGYLTETINEDGKTQRIPTNKGLELGIIMESKTNSRGINYLAVLYSVKAQKIIIENIPNIISK